MQTLASTLAVGLEIMLQGMNIFTLDDLAAGRQRQRRRQRPRPHHLRRHHYRT